MSEHQVMVAEVSEFGRHRPVACWAECSCGWRSEREEIDLEPTSYGAATDVAIAMHLTENGVLCDCTRCRD